LYQEIDKRVELMPFTVETDTLREYDFALLPGNLASAKKGLAEECAKLFSNHYGYWSEFTQMVSYL